MSTTEYPGVLRTFFGYLGETLPTMLKTMVGMAVICVFSLAPFLATWRRLTVYALFGFFGLSFYVGLLALADETSSVSEFSNSDTVNAVLALILLIYYNVIIFVATVFGLSAEIAGFSSIAPMVAAFIPVYDIKMARMNAPFSLAGALVLVLALFALLADKTERLLNEDRGTDALTELIGLKNQRTALLELLLKFLKGGPRRHLL